MTSNPIRFTGMFSGMDTQSMVQQLMRVENMRMDRLTRRRTSLQWRQEDLRSTMNSVSDFRTQNTLMNPPTNSTAITNLSLWNTMQAEVTARNGGSADGINITTSNASQFGQFDFRVEQVAQGDLVRGSTQFQANNINTPEGTPSVNVHHTIQQFMAAAGTEIGTNTEADIYINDVRITVRSNFSIQDFMTAVNNSDAGVNMSFDAARGRFVLESARTGDNAAVRVRGSGTETGDEFGFFERIGLANITDAESEDINPNVNDPLNTQRFIRGAQDAVVVMDTRHALGGVIMRQADNNFEFNGVRINIENIDRDALAAAGSSGLTFSVNVTRDVDDLMSAITDFIENYNNLIRQIHAMHSTPPARGPNRSAFEPLTNEERRAMSESEIELWEEQARQGLFHRDSDLRNFQSQLRQWMFESVPLGGGREIFLHQIGITTLSFTGTNADRMIGVLEIDEDVLRSALEGTLTNDRGELVASLPDIQSLFLSFGYNNQYAGQGVGSQNRNARIPHIGIARRLDDILNNANAFDGILGRRAGIEGGENDSTNPMTLQLRRYDDRIAQMEHWLIRRENHFFQMFGRMEQAMAQSNAQMDSLFAFAQM